MNFTKDNIPKCIECFNSYEHSSSFEISSFETLTINLKRISPSYCDVCERTHEHSDAYLHLKHCEDTDHVDLYFNCRKGESKFLGRVDLENEKHSTFLNDIDSIFPSGETTFDYTTGIFREMIISKVLLLNDMSVPSYDKLMEILKEKITCSNEEDKLEIEKLTISLFLWVIVYLMMTSPDTPLNKSILEGGLIVVESEDITTVTTTTKIINSDIFRSESGEKITTTGESTKVLKVITKIIVKDRDFIWAMISTSMLKSKISELLTSSEN